MIASFRSRALRRFWTRSERRAVAAAWADRIHLLLSALDQAVRASDMAVPGSGFHRLSGNQAGRYALTVSRNWRITFGWRDGNAVDVDLEDYHGT